MDSEITIEELREQLSEAQRLVLTASIYLVTVESAVEELLSRR